MGFAGDDFDVVARPANGDDVLTFVVPTRPDQIGPARRAVRQHLADRGVPASVADDLQLVTSELVTNAVRHGPVGEIDVEVRIGPAHDVALSVANPSAVAAIPPLEAWRPVAGRSVGGRGLGIVRRLCDDIEVQGDEAQAVIVCRRHWNGQEGPR